MLHNAGCKHAALNGGGGAMNIWYLGSTKHVFHHFRHHMQKRITCVSPWRAGLPDLKLYNVFLQQCCIDSYA